MLSKLVLRVNRLLGKRYGELSIEQAAAKVGQPEVFFFDVNGPARYARGHVPGAKHASPAQIDSSILPSNRDASLVFYCGGVN